ncbi:hypothetical protein ACJ41O_004537 [Fusarium nematophilum]
MNRRLYSKLPEGRFRLIKLLPGKWDDILKAELFEADQSFSYTALSYTWGSRRVLREIVLNGTSKGITVNLDLALRTLRLEHGPVTLWADALCINQEDVADKSEQVSFMNHIFHWATRVHAHVGDPLDRGNLKYEARLKALGPSNPFQFSEEDDLAWEETKAALSQLETRNPTELSPHERCLCIFGLLRALSVASLSAKLWETDLFTDRNLDRMESRQRCLFEWLRMFVVAPWWDRMWITQEVGVARELVLIYGRVTMPFQVLATLVKSQTAQPLHPKTLARENKRVIDLLVTKVKTISELRRLQQYESIAEMRDIDYFQRSLGSPLLWLLRTFRHRHSSEPRDKIYALCQLLKKLDIGSDYNLRTNYATTVAALFCKVAVRIMQETGLFWVTSADLVAKSRDNLPSWVPNWTDGFTTPDSESVAWKIRLCHNASNVSFLVEAPDPPAVPMHPPQYYRGLAGNDRSCSWRRLRGGQVDYYEPFQPGIDAGQDSTVFSNHFFLDWGNSEERRIRYEYHENHIRDFTKVENCLKISSQFCSTVEHVSQPIAPDLSNVFEIIEGLEAARRQVFPNDWKYELFFNRLQSIGRVLCFGALLQKHGDARRLEPYDDPDLAILVHLLTASKALTSDQELQGTEAWKNRHREKFTLEFRSECPDCSSAVDGPCADCHDKAQDKPVPSADAARRDPQIVQMRRSALQTAPGSCIMMTRQGTLALGPPQAQVGDRISILSGGLCPYILRRDMNPRYLNYLAFQLVGDCFLERTPRWDPGDLEIVALV